MYIRILMCQPPILVLLHHVNQGRLELKVVGIDSLTMDTRVVVSNNEPKIVS